jgi:long-chain acyl-CoA synthetase
VSIIEEELGVEIDESLVTDKTTVAELEYIIASQRKARTHKIRRWPLTRWAVSMRRLIQYGLVLPLMRYYVSLRVMGTEKFSGMDRPFLLIANHVSHMDAVILAMSLPWRIRKRLAVAAAADIFEGWDSSEATLGQKIFRKSTTALAVLGLNIFPFQRYAGIKKSLEYAGQLMDKGWSVMIFPEGRLSRDGKVQAFKSGVGLLVRELNIPVVPAKITGTYEIMDCTRVWPKGRGSITVRFGDPLEFSHQDTYEEITKRLEHEVRFL